MQVLQIETSIWEADFVQICSKSAGNCFLENSSFQNFPGEHTEIYLYEMEYLEIYL